MLNKEQKQALDIMLSGYNVFLSGGAGTGKSYLIHAFLEKISKKKYKNVLLCAPTGVAAINIGGVTIHSAFHVPTYPCPTLEEIPAILYKTNIIIIDEISMCRIDVFDYISEIISVVGKKIQIICVGDFYQLPPVVTDEDSQILCQYYGGIKTWAFQSKYWEQYNFIPIILSCNMRQKDKYYDNLLNFLAHGTDLENVTRKLNNTFSQNPLKEAIKLCPTRREVNQINNAQLTALKDKKFTFIASKSGKININDFQAPKKLELKRGCRVMSLINYLGDNICNGSLGSVLELTSNTIIVKFDNGVTKEIAEHTWEKYRCIVKNGKVIPDVVGTYTQIPLKLAYAATIHKSQGQTYDSVNITPDVFQSGMLYVALSRCRDCKNIYTTRPIRPSDVMVSPTVSDFYDNLMQ